MRKFARKAPKFARKAQEFARKGQKFAQKAQIFARKRKQIWSGSVKIRSCFSEIYPGSVLIRSCPFYLTLAAVKLALAALELGLVNQNLAETR